MKIDLIKPTLIVLPTQAQSDDGFLTYNQAGITYNELGETYGGAYGPIDDIRISVKFNLESPNMIVGQSDASLSEQNITYNQSGISYNEGTVMYGGLAGQTDKPPIMQLFTHQKPNIIFSDFSGTTSSGGTVILYAGMSMGLLLALTYPTDGTIIT